MGLAVLLARIADEYLAELLLQNFGKVPAVVQTIAGRYAELLFLPAWSLEGANLRQLFVAAPAATDKQLGPFPAAYVALLAPERLVSGLPAELVPVVTALCESSPLSLAAVRESAALLVQAS